MAAAKSWRDGVAPPADVEAPVYDNPTGAIYRITCTKLGHERQDWVRGAVVAGDAFPDLDWGRLAALGAVQRIDQEDTGPAQVQPIEGVNPVTVQASPADVTPEGA